MGVEDRALRERSARRRLITSTARELAEREGWDAVTTRRLSNEIEYSQPVLYKHFASMEAIIDAVALEGFAELAAALAHRSDGSPQGSLHEAAQAYCGFAADNPAVYDAMFTLLTRLPFGGTQGTPAPLSAAFGELRQIVNTFAGDRDAETLTEVVWAALHGLVTLTRSGRLRADAAEDRVLLLVAQFQQARAGSGPGETMITPDK